MSGSDLERKTVAEAANVYNPPLGRHSSVSENTSHYKTMLSVHEP